MALTRKLLKGLALNDETIDTIIEAHAETVDALKQRIADYEAKTGETESITKERDDWKKKYEALEKTSGDASKIQAEFDDYKKQVETKEANAKKTAALETVLKEIGITSESARKLFMRNYDLTGINLDDSGAIANRGDIETTIKTEYSDLISTQQDKGADPTNPPGGARTTDKDAFEKMSLTHKQCWLERKQTSKFRKAWLKQQVKSLGLSGNLDTFEDLQFIGLMAKVFDIAAMNEESGEGFGEKNT